MQRREHSGLLQFVLPDGLDAKASNAQVGITEPFCSPFPSFICFAVLSEKKYNLASLLRMHKDRQGPPAGALHVPRVSPRGPRWLPSAATIAWWLWQLRTQKSLSRDQQAWHWHQPMGSHRKVICSSSTWTLKVTLGSSSHEG